MHIFIYNIIVFIICIFYAHHTSLRSQFADNVHIFVAKRQDHSRDNTSTIFKWMTVIDDVRKEFLLYGFVPLRHLVITFYLNDGNLYYLPGGYKINNSIFYYNYYNFYDPSTLLTLNNTMIII